MHPLNFFIFLMDVKRNKFSILSDLMVLPFDFSFYRSTVISFLWYFFLLTKMCVLMDLMAFLFFDLFFPWNKDCVLLDLMTLFFFDYCFHEANMRFLMDFIYFHSFFVDFWWTKVCDYWIYWTYFSFAFQFNWGPIVDPMPILFFSSQWGPMKSTGSTGPGDLFFSYLFDARINW